MRKYEFKKFPIAAVTLSILGLVLAVVGMAFALTGTSSLGALALLEIVAAVLVLAGLTTGNIPLVRVVSTIVTVGTLIATFVLTCVKFYERNVPFFAICLLMLVAAVLALIYFLVKFNNDRIEKLYMVTGICFSSLAFVYAIAYAVKEICDFVEYRYAANFDNCFLLVAFAVISVLPVAAYMSLSQVDEKEAEKAE